jgi:hypothetical protein
VTLARRLIATFLAVIALTAWGADSDKSKAGLDKARNTVDRIRQADPPRVSSGTTSAGDIARRENAAERQRQAQESRRRHLDKHNVPPPGR